MESRRNNLWKSFKLNIIYIKQMYIKHDYNLMNDNKVSFVSNR